MDTSASNTLLETLSPQYDIWLATRFRVSATSYNEASAQAVAWLTKHLSPGMVDMGSGTASLAVTTSAQTLHDAAVLAIKLLALEEKGGDALRRVEQLRAEVEDQSTHSTTPNPVFASR